ncbi:MAG: hypothetical protein H0T45_17695 [Pyrinomonadaceae bacterium]|nr:hypothetical protein [Pyrinomonadaceae bacterium]
MADTAVELQLRESVSHNAVKEILKKRAKAASVCLSGISIACDIYVPN